MDIVEQTLNKQHDVYAKAREEYRKVIQQQRDEIERLRWENANMEKLWGKSEGTWMEIRDKQDAEIELLRKERDGLREALEKVLSVQPIKGDEGSTDIIALAKALLEIDSIARDALKDKQ